MEALRLGVTLRQGDSGPEVKLVQEWLSLRGTTLNITSHFGAPTAAAVLDFCAAEGLEPSQPFVDDLLFQRLVRPMREALAPVAPADGLRTTLLAIAERQLAQGAREVGGANCGPWVRLYMKGHEGSSWAAGFVAFCLERACEALGEPLPFASSTRVEALIEAATKQGRHVIATGGLPPIRPGDLFVARSENSRAVQTGLVRALDGLGFHSIEGGDRVMSKRRSFVGCDFFRTAA